MNAKLSELKPCPYRYGIAKKGRVLFECRYAGETYDVEEMAEICNNFCPFLSYQIGIARIFDYEPSGETTVMLEDLDIFGGEDILKQKQEIEKIAEKACRFYR